MGKQPANCRFPRTALPFIDIADSTGAFAAKYSARYGSNPGIASDTGYDTLMVIADAIQRTKTFDISVVKEAMLKSDYSGASGKITFDAKGGVVKTSQFWIAKEGKQVFFMESL